MSFSSTLKNLFFALLFLQFLPPMFESLKKQYGRYFEQKTSVAVVEIKGVLYSSTSYTRLFHKYFKDQSIKAILIKMECPGAAAGTAQAIFNELKELKKEHNKPVVTLVENVCASGGYYIASATDHIIAPASAVVGSIGTALSYTFKLKEFIEQFKIHYIPIDAGQYKGSTNPFTDLTPEQKQLLQGITDDSYDQFAQDVAKERNLAMTQLTTWADGKIFTGRQALALGLIDEVGSASTAIKALKEKALIEGEIEWVKHEERHGIMRLFGESDSDDSEGSMFTTFMDKFWDTTEQRYLTPRVTC